MSKSSATSRITPIRQSAPGIHQRSSMIGTLAGSRSLCVRNNPLDTRLLPRTRRLILLNLSERSVAGRATVLMHQRQQPAGQLAVGDSGGELEPLLVEGAQP